MGSVSHSPRSSPRSGCFVLCSPHHRVATYTPRLPPSRTPRVGPFGEAELTVDRPAVAVVGHHGDVPAAGAAFAVSLTVGVFLLAASRDSPALCDSLRPWVPRPVQPPSRYRPDNPRYFPMGSRPPPDAVPYGGAPNARARVRYPAQGRYRPVSRGWDFCIGIFGRTRIFNPYHPRIDAMGFLDRLTGGDPPRLTATTTF